MAGIHGVHDRPTADAKPVVRRLCSPCHTSRAKALGAVVWPVQQMVPCVFVSLALLGPACSHCGEGGLPASLGRSAYARTASVPSGRSVRTVGFFTEGHGHGPRGTHSGFACSAEPGARPGTRVPWRSAARCARRAAEARVPICCRGWRLGGWMDFRESAGAGRGGSGLCVPRTLSTSCDQAVFVDHATDASVSPDVVSLEVDRLG
jgi:hypothetical protein